MKTVKAGIAAAMFIGAAGLMAGTASADSIKLHIPGTGPDHPDRVIIHEHDHHVRRHDRVCHTETIRDHTRHGVVVRHIRRCRD